MNARKCIIIPFILTLATLSAFGHQQTQITDIDCDEWIKLEIKEAFISRQTYIDFKDANTDAEFGWHVKINNTFACRGNRLYATMYYPSIPNATVRLILVELDPFSDDIVSGVNLTDVESKYELNKNGDWAVISRTVFRPDAQSGPDTRPSGARDISGDISDSVSFLDGDFTDYLRLRAQTLALLITPHHGLSCSSSSARILPSFGGMKSARFIIPNEEGSIIRIRAPLGAGKSHYQILSAQGPSAFDTLLDKAIAYLEKASDHSSIFLSSDMALAFCEYNCNAVKRKCAGLGSRISKSRNLAKFCTEVRKEKAR